MRGFLFVLILDPKFGQITLTIIDLPEPSRKNQENYMTQDIKEANYTITALDHRDPGYGNQVQVCVESETEDGLSAGIDSYTTRWHPCGYDTRVSSRYSKPGGFRAIMTRLASCD